MSDGYWAVPHRGGRAHWMVRGRAPCGFGASGSVRLYPKGSRAEPSGASICRQCLRSWAAEA